MPLKGERKVLTGQRFGRLVVGEIVSEDHDKRGYFTQYRYQCKCDCGGERIVPANSLKSGRCNSCGCLHTEELLRRNVSHGMTGTDLFFKYYHMKARCYNPKEQYYYCYGGRGIIIAQEWLGENGFTNFVEWAISNGYKEGLTIDRIDVNGNYEPSNCRWIPMRYQFFNKQNTIYRNGVSVAQKAYECGLNYKTIHDRIKRGWADSELFLPPLRKRKKGKDETNIDINNISVVTFAKG